MSMHELKDPTFHQFHSNHEFDVFVRFMNLQSDIHVYSSKMYISKLISLFNVIMLVLYKQQLWWMCTLYKRKLLIISTRKKTLFLRRNLPRRGVFVMLVKYFNKLKLPHYLLASRMLIFFIVFIKTMSILLYN